jgi:Undecaprenyl-phosphate glucose phosphotransferase
MLKKHTQLFESLLLISDLLIIVLSWLFSYYLRFYSNLLPAEKGIPDIFEYSLLLIPIIIIWGFVFKMFGLYRPKRINSHLSEVLDIFKASVASVLVLISITFFLRQYEFSRLVFLFFIVINIFSLSFERMIFREILRFLRRKGYNLRFALVVGTGGPANSIIHSIERHPEVGIKIKGIISIDPADMDKKIQGIKVLDTYENIRHIIRKYRIDNVFIALSWQEHARVVEVLRSIEDEMVDIKVIPDLYEFMTLRGGVEEFDGIPILNLQNSPLYGWNSLIKRTGDVIFAGISITILSPFLLLIAILIKMTSPGPVLYKQERMGVGGEIFNIMKFRSMKTDAENETGAIWASKDDPRRTKFGSFLRKTSLDELPQLFNVLKGNMSLVGPRPERPVFIEEFRKNIPKYMLRHTMKAGITGWAQVNGWRGNTDIKKRIEHDLYYIENWSLSFDIKILFLTILSGFINRNAY